MRCEPSGEPVPADEVVAVDSRAIQQRIRRSPPVHHDERDLALAHEILASATAGRPQTSVAGDLGKALVARARDVKKPWYRFDRVEPAVGPARRLWRNYEAAYDARVAAASAIR
jgi:hypothetical protein